jgi:hypothetical protein
MRRIQIRAAVALTLVLPALNGCLWHTRRVPMAKVPANVQTATPEQLVDIINRQYDAIDTMDAKVTFTATEGGTLNGKVKTITPFSGYILLRKPESLRVFAFLPVVHTRAFDMASDGQTFQLWIPSKDKVIEGTNTVTQKSPNAIENMRPYIFFDSLLIRKIGPEELLLPTTDSPTVVNPKTKKLELLPEYLLTVLGRKGSSNVLLARRVIHFSRLDLRPVEEDIYDDAGQVQTVTTYGPMQKFGTERYPGTITIKRPLEQYQILITFQTLRVNLPLDDQQFQLTVPKGTPVEKLP